MYIIVQTYLAYGEASHNSIRARPIAGQGFSIQINVRCSVKMRRSAKVGAFFKLWISPTTRIGATNLYSNERDKWIEINAEEAATFVRENFGS